MWPVKWLKCYALRITRIMTWKMRGRGGMFINVKSFKPLKFIILLLTLPFHIGPEYFDAFTMLQDFSEANLSNVVAFTMLLNSSFSKLGICF